MAGSGCFYTEPDFSKEQYDKQIAGMWDEYKKLNWKPIELSDFKYRKFSEVRIVEDAVYFVDKKGWVYKLEHSQECCETVELIDVIGDIEDLQDSEILMCGVETSSIEKAPDGQIQDDASQWTFYKFGTKKGYVTLRWWGSSNGYYSVDVNISIAKFA
jgi:hypothetical protein